jgi:Tfp pilus assembly protein PilX
MSDCVKASAFAVKQAGLSLLTALIFLQIIAILGMYAIESAIQAEKMSRLAWRQTQVLLAGEQALRSVEQMLLYAIPDCLLTITPQNELLAKSISWWQSPARCMGRILLFDYYFVVEKLSSVVCSNLDHSGSDETKMNKADFYRITLLIIDKKNESREMLQSTLVSLDNAIQNCVVLQHPVFSGQQTWRELR